MDYIEFLKKYRSAEISDALDSLHIEGALLKIKPLVSGFKLIGPVFTVQYQEYNNRNDVFKQAGNYIDNVPAHSVIIINNQYKEDCSVWGEILTQFALKRNIAGTIVAGVIRDTEAIRSLDYPIFSSGTYMRSGKNRVQMVGQQVPLIINNITIQPNDIAFADDDGVIIIPQSSVKEIIRKAENIQLTESKIKKALEAGITLEQARKEYGYDKPWERN